MPSTAELTEIKAKFLKRFGDSGEQEFKAWAKSKGIKLTEPSPFIQINGKALTFSTDQLAIEHKGEDYFVTGYISTSDIDEENDVVTKECLADMVEQLKTRNIKLDVEHEAYKKDPTIIPIGKIVDARLDAKGIWVKAVINAHSNRFKEIWDSLKSGFIDAFSITFRAIDAVEKTIKETGDTIRMLNKVNLLNVALTGNPCNREAKIMEVFAKSLSTNEVKMTDKEIKKELKDDEPVVEPTEDAPEAPAEESTEAKVEVVDTKSISDLLTEVKSLKADLAELKKQEDESKELTEELKSLREQVKEMKEKMSKPVFKATAEDSEAVAKSMVESKELLSYIQ
jgi:HK97 family phage prohead protease